MELREFLFKPLQDRSYSFAIRARENGILSGAARMQELAMELGLEVISVAQEGALLVPGTPVFVARGDAEMVTRAEETLMGAIGKPSGVATAAADIVKKASPVKVVCGAWKKISQATKGELRQAVMSSGAGLRMTEEPFVYLDKNYIRMFGGVAAAVGRAKLFDPDRLAVVQLRGEAQSIVEEARTAVEAGAGILMVDTGILADFKAVKAAAATDGWRKSVKLAFAGGVTPEELSNIVVLGPDIIDVGRAILDAPLLDFGLDVEG
ncbi:nicotinate-nucleotide pyrophosphorylase [Desulfosporosinus orientis DSM 765]|uniref:Nicotinate-nucleotide pyrophosphorylase n=1 Tax=Desulfosporosinus orientis (strain ATCC 19365 / DSM 765 / NCIMB 8382 / VKM B-1628 / Singapore I) TaxID=768706 RepID=G7W585_DESOD|nr:nicotinate-nucleotide pyrophosphorylase [Desulfosporosinus orientis]AET66313.1 nicotinate-nucleotide pyrophosphorylase [Desulfosporosinus orientis DSM 765]